MRGYFCILDARWYNRSMNNDIVQLTDKSGNNIYPIAGGATQDSISKAMLAEGVFEGPELFPSPNEAYVRTDNIVDGAVTSDKIDWTTLGYQSARLSTQTTVTSTAAYEQMPVTGLAITIDGPVGAKYLVIGAISFKGPSGGYGDIYNRIHVDGVTSASIASNEPAADKYVTSTVVTEVVATSSSQTIQTYVSGSAIGTYTIGAYSSLTVIRVA